MGTVQKMRSPDNTRIIQQNGFILRLLLEEEHFNSLETKNSPEEQGSTDEFQRINLTETLVDLDAKLISVSKNIEDSTTQTTDFDEIAYFWTLLSIIGPVVVFLVGSLFVIYQRDYKSQ